LLQSTGNWAADATNLRQQITDYFGAGGENIELSLRKTTAMPARPDGNPRVWSTDFITPTALGNCSRPSSRDLSGGICGMRHELNGGFFGANLYGWRNNGDLGMVGGLDTRYPPFYAAKLMQSFARPGDKILGSASDYTWLTSYAARRANGSVSLLVLNKSLLTNLNAQISLSGLRSRCDCRRAFLWHPQR
jgi:hypothetical protein